VTELNDAELDLLAEKVAGKLSAKIDELPDKVATKVVEEFKKGVALKVQQPPQQQRRVVLTPEQIRQLKQGPQS